MYTNKKFEVKKYLIIYFKSKKNVQIQNSSSQTVVESRSRYGSAIY